MAKVTCNHCNHEIQVEAPNATPQASRGWRGIFSLLTSARSWRNVAVVLPLLICVGTLTYNAGGHLAARDAFLRLFWSDAIEMGRAEHTTHLNLLDDLAAKSGQLDKALRKEGFIQEQDSTVSTGSVMPGQDFLEVRSAVKAYLLSYNALLAHERQMKVGKSDKTSERDQQRYTKWREEVMGKTPTYLASFKQQQPARFEDFVENAEQKQGTKLEIPSGTPLAQVTSTTKTSVLAQVQK